MSQIVMDLMLRMLVPGDSNMQSRFPAFVIVALQVFRWLAHPD